MTVSADPSSRLRALSRAAAGFALVVVPQRAVAQTRAATTAISVEVSRDNRAIVHPVGAANPQQACAANCTLELEPGEYVVDYVPLRSDPAGPAPASRRFTVGATSLRIVNRGRPAGATALVAIGGAALTVGTILGAVAILGSITHFGPDPGRDWKPEGISAGACLAAGIALFVPGVLLSNPIAVELLDDRPRASARRPRRIQWTISPGTVASPIGVSVSIVHF